MAPDLGEHTGGMSEIADPRRHWNAAYARVGEQGGSWYQDTPRASLAMIELSGVPPTGSVLDAGGGASTLVDHLLDRGWHDVTVLDVSAEALSLSRQRLGDVGATVSWVEHDVVDWQPQRKFDLWHDRAVFHFLVDEVDRKRYLDVVLSGTGERSRLIIGTFAADGPTMCSGLEVARYSPTELAAAVGAPWRPLAERRDEHRTPSGSVQPFTWLLFERIPSAPTPAPLNRAG